MRRWCLLLLVSSLLFAAGCGRDSYARRLEATIKQKERDRTIEKNLMAAPTGDKKFTDLSIYVRPPREEVQAKAGQLAVADPGQFDLEASFVDAKAGANLHVLARVKLPKKAPTKGAPPPPPPAARGDFVKDVLAVLTGEFGASEKLDNPKFESDTKRGNQFKRLVAIANDKEVKLYTYKQDNHEVALIFVYDPKLRAAIAKRIDLCLETFAAGAKATRLYSPGGESEDEDAGAPVPM